MDQITANVYNSILMKSEENSETPRIYHPRKMSSLQQASCPLYNGINTLHSLELWW